MRSLLPITVTLIGCAVAPTAPSPGNEVASLQVEPWMEAEPQAEPWAEAESALEAPPTPPTLTGERETLRACMVRLADTWERPLEYRLTGEVPQTSSAEWRLEDGAGREVVLRLVEDSTLMTVTVIPYEHHVVRLTQSPSNLRDLASQPTRLEFAGYRSPRRSSFPETMEWSAVEEVVDDARACRRRLLAHGRRNIQEAQRAPAECSIAHTRNGCFRICSRRARLHEARVFQRELTEHADEFCAAIASVRDALECFPTAALVPSSSAD